MFLLPFRDWTEKKNIRILGARMFAVYVEASIGICCFIPARPKFVIRAQCGNTRKRCIIHEVCVNRRNQIRLHRRQKQQHKSAARVKPYWRTRSRLTVIRLNLATRLVIVSSSFITTSFKNVCSVHYLLSVVRRYKTRDYNLGRLFHRLHYFSM